MWAAFNSFSEIRVIFNRPMYRATDPKATSLDKKRTEIALLCLSAV